MAAIRPFTAELDEYLKDESRSVGTASSISFPLCEDEVRALLKELHSQAVPITIQGGRTGLAAGAVPQGGHVLNLSKMNRCLAMRTEQTAGPESQRFFITVQPGVVLSQLRKDLEDKNVSTAGWNAESLAAWDAFTAADEQFFPTDPTETSATIGGIVACNASGARSYSFGPARPHVSALRVLLADGDAIDLRRGQTHAHNGHLALTTESGRRIEVSLPGYTMPHAKNASGYYVEPSMDAIDLFIGSDGTLGAITQIELALEAVPAITWGVSCFLPSEQAALDFTVLVRDSIASAAALEYFDADALDILRAQKENSTAFANLPAIDANAACCVYVELMCASEEQAYAELYRTGELLAQVGGNERMTWVGRTALDREAQRFFRHAVPESVNMLIDERRKTDPAITKLGSDMSVPDEHLHEVVAMYRHTLAEEGLQTAVWGHIGDNHLHVNVLPRDAADYARGKALYQRWAQTVSEMGGAVSAEHGVGKLKRDFLRTMYGDEAIAQMAHLKLQLDPLGQLGRGNLFGEDLLAASTQVKEA